VRQWINRFIFATVPGMERLIHSGYDLAVDYLLRFVLIASFAVGLPTCVLAFVALKGRGYLERCFLTFLVCFLVLMLCEALIYYLQAIPQVGRTWILVLFAACRVLVALLAVDLWLLAVEVAGY
jgi:hypothetical protein